MTHFLWPQFLQGNFLDDVHRLHLPTLTWKAPPQVHGRPARAMRNIAGHSLDGLLAFGGCVPTTLGIMPVAKADPLLLGIFAHSSPAFWLLHASLDAFVLVLPSLRT